MFDDTIEKGKLNVGDTKIYQGVTYVVGGFNAKGNPLWRKADKKPGAAPAMPQGGQNKPTAQEEHHEAPAPKEEPKPQAAPPKPYDAPKPTVTYSTKPEIEYQVPEEWKVTDKTGKLMTQTRSELRKKFADVAKFTDDKLIAIVNAVNMNNPYVRHMAWEEAAHRGIPESKLNVSGSLKNAWENYAERYKLTHKKKEDDDEEEDLGSMYNSAIGSFNVEAFKEEFPDGDTGWANPDDPRVKKAFNNLITLKNRQQWDAVVDKLKRDDPLYEGVDDQLNGLRIQFDAFLNSDPKRGSAMFVSTGGAGAGKSYALKQIIEANGMALYDPENPLYSDPTAPNVDAVEVANDIDSEKDFFDFLRKYNGKTIIFDDKDKALVSNATKIKSAVKNIADSDYKKRIIPGEAGGKPELFKGKLIYITNKSFDDLISDEDHKAIFSRADKNDVHFTLNENLEVLGKRYKTMEGPIESLTKQEENELRQKVYDIIIENVDKIDPMKFTVRKFSEMVRESVGLKEAAEKANKNAQFEDLFGGKNSASMNWRRQMIKMLNKGFIDNDIEKARSEEIFNNLSDDAIVIFKRKLEKDPKKFKEMFGEKFIKFLKMKDGAKEEDVEEELVSKAIIDEFCEEITLDEAEKLLLG